MSHTLIIAEAGVNHNGQEALALKLVDEAINAGADIVKFQTFKAEKLVTKTAQKADYQKKTTDSQESQFEMLKKLELSESFYKRLISHCHKNKIEFMSTAFDKDSLKFLINELGVSRLKIPSGEITNGPLLLDYAQTQLPIILSTGMASLSEVENALKVLAYGFLYSNKRPSSFTELEAVYRKPEAKNALKNRLTILHCTTEYPAPLNEINMRAMQAMGDKFGLPMGYSDHTEGILVPVVATACGATVIEKHFTTDKSLPGPDHKASLEPQELREMVRQIRLVEKVLGKGEKAVQASEEKNRKVARRSLIAACDIAAGDVFSEKNVDVMRPEGGASPIQFWDYLGKEANRGFKAGEFIL